MVQVTTTGLQNNAATSTDVDTVQWAEAAGTADVLTAAFGTTITALVDGLIVGVRALLANATTTPTFSPDTLTAKTIVKGGGLALVAGDIAGVGHELFLRYDLGNTRWELLNPYVASDVHKSLTADATGTNVATAQPWFPSAGGVTLAAGSYLFRGVLRTSRADGFVSHTTGVSFGGTAAITGIDYLGKGKKNDTNALADLQGFFGSAATTLVLKSSSNSPTEQTVIEVDGVVIIGTAGTFIPQFIYSAAPGGAPTIARGTFFTLRPIHNPAGAWA